MLLDLEQREVADVGGGIAVGLDLARGVHAFGEA